MGRRPVRANGSMDPGTPIPPSLDRSFMSIADWADLEVVSRTRRESDLMWLPLLWGPPWRPLTEGLVEGADSRKRGWGVLTGNLPAIIFISLDTREHIGGRFSDVQVSHTPVDTRLWGDFRG